MASQTPRIVRFFSEDWGLGIDWDITLYAFELERDFGGAKLFGVPANFQVAIDLPKIKGFRLIPGSEAGLAEVIMEVTFHSGQLSLGTTGQIEEAERWVQEANKIITEVRAARGKQTS